MWGKRVAILSAWGGECSLAAEASEKWGMELAAVSPQTQKKLNKLFPDWITASNPVDFGIATWQQDYRTLHTMLLEAFLEDANVDAVVTPIWVPSSPEYEFFAPIESIKQVACRFNRSVNH